MAKPKTPPLPPSPPRWDSSHAGYVTGRSYIDAPEHLAAQAEAHWGCGRLRLLVSQELREKFDRQRTKFQHAVQHGMLEDVIRESERMTKAWTALDTEARAQGCEPVSCTVWEVTLDDGTVAAIVQDDRVAKAVIADGRRKAVYTLEEIGRLLSHYGEIVTAKLTFPGATVTRVARTVTDPLVNDGLPY